MVTNIIINTLLKIKYPTFPAFQTTTSTQALELFRATPLTAFFLSTIYIPNKIISYR